MSTDSSTAVHQAARAPSEWRTSGLLQLTRPQTIGTLSGLMLSMLLAALDQTIVGTAEPKIIASLSGFDRYPWVSTAYLLCSTISVPIFAKLSDIYGRKWFLLGGSAGFVLTSALCGAAGKFSSLGLDGMNQLILFRSMQGICGGGTRPLSGRVFGGLGFRFCVWTNTGRLAHRPDFMASHVLRQLTCWNYRGHCSVPLFSFLAPQRGQAPHRLGRCGYAD